MATTVSRRFVFVKMKGRGRQKPKNPRPEPREDDELVGEAARPSRPLQVSAPLPRPRKTPWALIATGVGGLVVVALVVALVAGMAGRPVVADSPAATETPRGFPTYPGYSRTTASGGGYPGGGTGSGMGAGRPAATAEGFLASPFPKRKPKSCSVQVDGSPESLREFSKCLEQANAAE